MLSGEADPLWQNVGSRPERCKSQQILNCCHPNALLTIKKYLQDYASPQTRQMGLAMTEQELNKLSSDKVRTKAVTYLAAIENRQRDFRF